MYVLIILLYFLGWSSTSVCVNGREGRGRKKSTRHNWQRLKEKLHFAHIWPRELWMPFMRHQRATWWAWWKMPTSLPSMQRGSLFNPGTSSRPAVSMETKTGTSWPTLVNSSSNFHVKCELWTVFIVILYIVGVGINPGNLPCTTCVRPGCKRYMVGGI